MFSDFRKAREAPKELNVLPVMNLMVTLIPFLLLGAAFYKVAVISTTLPTHDTSAEAPDKPPSDEIITLNMIIKPDAIELSATSPTVAPETLEALNARVLIQGGSLDLKQLTAGAARFKRAYPKSDTVLVLPDPDTPYQTLVELLDAIREQKSTGPEGQEIKHPLFPVSVFSRFNKEEPDAGVAEEGGEGAGEGEEAPAP